MIYNKLTKKIILVLIFSLISCIIFTNTTYASSLDDMISSADDFLATGSDDAILTGPDSPLAKTSEYIYNTLLVIAVAVAVIVGTYLGIKFMMESAEDKAKIKEAMIPFIVGCFVVFGAFGIWRIVVNVGNGISGEISSSKVAGAENYYEWLDENNISEDDAVGVLMNMDFSKLDDTEKEEYRKIVTQASVVFKDKRSEQLVLNNILKKYLTPEETPEPTPEPVPCKAKDCDEMASKYNDKGYCATHYQLYKAKGGE